MAQAIDAKWLGTRLRQARKDRGDLTLKDVSQQTGISIPTLSRIERGDCQTVTGDTLFAMTNWLGISITEVGSNPSPPPAPPRLKDRSIPDIVELHLRADKKLNRETALALARLFRTAYDQVAGLKKAKE